MNVNSKGSKPIYNKGALLENDVIKADDTVMFCYDGSSYVVSSLGGGGAAPVNPNETVNISLTQVNGNSSDLIGAAVTITNDDTSENIFTATWNGNTITTEIDVNTNYTVSVDTIAGYSRQKPQSYQADYQNERNISFQYIASGVYIESTDHQIYTTAQWASAGKTGNSVVVIAENTSFRISSNESSTIALSDEGTLDPYLTIPSNPSSYFNGPSDTEIIKTRSTLSSNGALYCTNYTFPDGFTKGYLPSSGDLNVTYLNLTQINLCFQTLNWTQIIVVHPTHLYWSSTRSKANYVFALEVDYTSITSSWSIIEEIIMLHDRLEYIVNINNYD